VKDLSRLGRDLKDIIIVDNSPACYTLQPTNAIPISTWLSDPKDDMLSQLAPLLKLLFEVDDVRTYLPWITQNPSIDYIASYNELKSKQAITLNKAFPNANTHSRCANHGTQKLERNMMKANTKNRKSKRFSVTNNNMYTHEISKTEDNVRTSVSKKLKKKHLQEEDTESCNESACNKELAKVPKQSIEKPMLINSLASGSRKCNKYSSSIKSYEFLNKNTKKFECPKDNVRVSDTNLLKTPIRTLIKIPLNQLKMARCLMGRASEAEEVTKKIPTTCYSPGNLIKSQKKSMKLQRKLTSCSKASTKASSSALGSIYF
jgi:RNA polymerase II subunit A small phosphatase-like protein